jgi:hypothetical protein
MQILHPFASIESYAEEVSRLDSGTPGVRPASVVMDSPLLDGLFQVALIDRNEEVQALPTLASSPDARIRRWPGAPAPVFATPAHP